MSSLPTSSPEHSTYENLNINTNTIMDTNRTQEIRIKCTHCTVCVFQTAVYCSKLSRIYNEVIWRRVTERLD